MCDPTVAAIATVIGTAVSAYGQYQSGRAASAAGSYNAAAQQQQAATMQQYAQQQADATRAEADAQATAAQQAAARDEAVARDRFRRLQATARASLGISGQTGEGSATELLAENAAAGELDAQTIRYGGVTRAAALRRGGAITADNILRQASLNAGALGSQAGMSLYQGQVAQQNAYIGAGATLLSGSGSFARNFRWGNNGLEFRAA